MPPDPSVPAQTVVRFARPEDLRAAAEGFAECFGDSIWARVGVHSSQAYLEHYLRDPREFLIVADDPCMGIVGACTGTMRMGRHRRGLMVRSLPRLGFGVVRDVAEQPRKALAIAGRVRGGVIEAVRRRLGRSEPPPPIEHVKPEWSLEIEPVAGFLTTYYVSPRARGQQLAGRMTDFAVDLFRRQGFVWLQLHVYAYNVASQKIVMRSGYDLVWRQGEQNVYRQWVGEGRPDDLAVRILEEPAGEAKLADLWAELLAKTPEASGFHAWAWIAANLPDIDAPRVGIVSLGGAPVAVFPLQLDGGRLCFIAEGRSNYCGPVYDPDHLQSVVAGFRQIVERCRPASVDLRGLRERSPFRERVGELVLGDLGPAIAVETVGCPEVELEGGWDAVWNRHKAKHRKSWKRARRKLEQLGAVELQELTEPDEIVAALPDAIRLYEARWEGLNVDTAFGRETAEFQRSAASELARDGHAIMTVLRLESEIIAFSYALRANAMCTSYTLAHDDRYSLYSLGQLLLIEVLERAAARSDPMFDFSVGDEPYKALWSTRRQGVFRLRWGPGARAGAGVDDLRRRLRAQPKLRDLKREGLRAVLPRRRVREVTWSVQEVLGRASKDVEASPMTLAEMRSLLVGDLFAVAIDRAFRGDAPLLLRERGRAVAVVWRAAPSRRAGYVRGLVETPRDRDVYVDPRALRKRVDWRELFGALGPGLLVTTEPVFPAVLARFEAARDLPVTDPRS